MGSARASVMKFLVLLSVVSLASAAPLPEGEEAAVAVEAEAPVAVEEDAPAALPYVHDATGDVAEPYVHEDGGQETEDKRGDRGWRTKDGGRKTKDRGWRIRDKEHRTRPIGG